jgi:hypothetical protein
MKPALSHQRTCASGLGEEDGGGEVGEEGEGVDGACECYWGEFVRSSFRYAFMRFLEYW